MRAARNTVYDIVRRTYSRVYAQVRLPNCVGGRIFEGVTVNIHHVRRAVRMDIET
jgi:hypothetical protein